MRHEIEVSEFSAVIQEFAAYKSAIPGLFATHGGGVPARPAHIFRYLLCREDAEVLNDPERFATVSVLPVDLEYLRTVTADRYTPSPIYADSVRENPFLCQGTQAVLHQGTVQVSGQQARLPCRQPCRQY